MTPEALHHIHAASFTLPRPWSADEFAGFLADPACLLLTRPGAFLIGRAVLDEAELLTLATAPEARRRGHARALLAEFTRAMQARGAATAFLEVASDNAPAQALYAGAGWERTGQRRNYYASGVDAIVMRKTL
ncbi:MAG: GNAT family N-acetyltransferase [Paracoccus sp. (in: a-proteobacteria)]|nr:GNAT family N-acetyltransferase [Paracoccus sp. (in: a-proteobacteria)]